MKILMRNVGMTLHVIHKLRARGHRQRQGQHGLAAPAHERREPRGVRGDARGRGAARPPARELGLGHLRRRQHGRRDRVHGDARARRRASPCGLRRRTASGSASTCTRTRRTPVAAVRRQRAAVALHRLRRGADRRRRARERRSRKRTPSPRTSSSTRHSASDASSSASTSAQPGVKALALSPEGDVLARAEESYELSTPHPGWAEQDPEDWWQRRRAGAGRARGRDRPSIGLSGQMHGLVVLDDRDRVLRPAILWNDQRTEAECVEIEERVGLTRLIQLTGNRALTGFTAPKLLWLRRHEPTTYAQVAHVLLPKDYVRLRLTGEHAIDVADASGTLLFDVREAALESGDARGSRARPGLAAAGARVAGGLGRDGRRALRSPRVLAIKQRRHSASGVDRPGPVSVVLGTSGVVVCCACRPSPPIRRRACTRSATPFRAAGTRMGVMLSAAGSLRWLRDVLGPRGGYDELTAAAEEWTGGHREGYLPAPTSPVSGRPTRTRTPGLRSPGSRFATTAAALVRAVLEGVAYGAALTRSSCCASSRSTHMTDTSPVAEPRSELWLRISRLGHRTARPAHNGRLRAPPTERRYSAGVAAGVFRDVHEAVATCVRLLDPPSTRTSVG